ncbi:MAG: GNAT family N-acetyltransferase [Ignavibacteriae bacterium]|nr:GNAT family N-acetyltransferase [Ignavibacteriota bacterium]
MTTEINFNPFPFLRSQKIILRKLKDTDNIDLSKLRSDKRVNEFLDRPDHLSEEDAGKLISKLNEGIDSNEYIIWAISLSGDENLIGTICLWNLDIEYRLAEIGFELMPEFQQKGLMSEAIDLVVNYAFSSMRIKRIEGFANEKNQRAFKVMERSGFTRDKSIESDIKSNEPDFVNIAAYKLEN